MPEETIIPEATTEVAAKEFPFNIGADPEFVLLAGEKFVPARDAMQKFMPRVKGTASGDGGYRVGEHGTIGWDGMNATAEIRPTAEKDPVKLVAHIGALIAKGVEAFPFLDLSPLSLVNSTGGHIHLEVPQMMTTSLAMRRAKLLCALVAPIMAGENQVSAEYRRSGNGYGKIDDIRVERHFNWPSGADGYTAEIRFPTAEWLITPRITAATLTLFGVVWHAVLTDEKFRKAASEVAFRNSKESEAVVTLIASKYAKLGDALVSKMRRLVRAAPLYETFKAEVDFAMNGRLVLAEKEKAGWLINVGWGFSQTPVTPAKRTFLSNSLVSKALGKSEEGDFTDFVPVISNGDLNLSFFEGALAERIAAFKWRPLREYFLFGLKESRSDGALVAFDNDGFYAGSEHGADMRAIVESMRERAKKQLANRSKIDIRTAKFRGPQNPVVVGIPFQMRANKQTKDFLSLIIDIDRGRLKAKAIDFSVGKEASVAPSMHTETVSSGLSDSVASAVSDRLTVQSASLFPGGTYDDMDLSNLRNWRSSGTFLADLRPNMDDTYAFENYPEDHYVAWYQGSNNTVIDLGADRTKALRVIEALGGTIGEVFSAQSQEIMRKATAVLNDYQNFVSA